MRPRQSHNEFHACKRGELKMDGIISRSVTVATECGTEPSADRLLRGGRNRTLKSLFLASTTLAFAALAPAANAQMTEDATDPAADEEYAMERVIVQARKRSEAVIDIPET